MKKKYVFFVTDVPLREMRKVWIKPLWFRFSNHRTSWGDPKSDFWTEGEEINNKIAVYNGRRQQYLIPRNWLIGLPKIEQPF